MALPTREEKLEFVKKSKKWYHTIDLGDGVAAKGDPGNNEFKWNLIRSHISRNCVGMTVGDFGSAEGYFSLKMFQCGCEFSTMYERIQTTIDKIHFVMKCYDVAKYQQGSGPGGDCPGYCVKQWELDDIIHDCDSWTKIYDYTFALAIYHWLKDPIRFLQMLSAATKKKCFFEIKVNDKDNFGLRSERANCIKWDIGHGLFVNLAKTSGFDVVKLLGDYMTSFGSHRALYVLGKAGK